MRVSINDVARAAGVSPTTVSHVISGHRSVSQHLQDRVRQVMAELDYSPMRSARNLALGKTQLIGLLVPDIGNTFFAELAKGAERVASGSGYNIVLGNTGFDRMRGLTHLEMIRSRAVDGVVYAAGSPFTDDEIINAIGSLPLVLVDEEVAGSNAPWVTSDNIDGGRAVAEHLLDHGHRRVLVLHATSGLGSSDRRVEGFLDAWRAGGGGDARLVDGGFTSDGGQKAVRTAADQLLNGEFTAVFAANDEMAFGALRQCRALGLSVPADVSVIGFDDVAVARDTVPALSTVRQDVAAMGERAGQIMLDLLSGTASETREVTLPVSLVVRESTGPAPRPRRPRKSGGRP
ncbi:MAG: LacI family DNA-binding transcriptional regulator [Propionicimonas sp.]